MNKTVKLIAVGNSTGVILPRDLLDRLQLERGDSLALSEVDGRIELAPGNSEFEAQMAIARDVMRRRRRALRELAK